MLAALAFVTFKQWRRHKLRLTLTTVGIALGVAVFFAARTSSVTVRASLKTTVEKIAGKATLQVTAGESGFPEEVLETVRSTEGVEVAEPVIEVVARTAFEDGGDLLILGVDTTSDQRLREYQFDETQTEVDNPLALVTRADSIVVSRGFADKHRLMQDDKLRLHTSQGLKELTVRGVFKPVGIGEVLGGQTAIMDIYSARLVFNRGRNFDRIDLMTDPNVAVETVQQRLRERLSSGLQVTRPSMRDEGLDNWVGAMDLGQEVMSYVALAIGVFLIFNSFSVAVNQRWKEIGILRALGVEARNIQRMFLGEAVVLGVLGSAMGVAGGWYVSAVASRVMNTVAASAYGQMSGPSSQVFRLDYAIASFAVGLAASLVAAWLPARAASQINPALSLHNIETRQREAVLGWRRITTGLVLIVGGLALVRFATARAGLKFQFIYCAVILLGFVLLLPRLIGWLARGLRPVMDFALGLEGVLAVDTMVGSPRRTSATVGAVMIGLSFVFSIGATLRSHYDAILGSIDRTLNADLMVRASTQLRSLTYRFDEAFGNRIAAISGVSSAEIKRLTFVRYGSDTVALIATDTAVWLARVGDILDEGDYKTACQRVPTGEGVLIAENFARRFNIGLGDRVRLDAPAGTLELPVIGIVEDYHSDKGTLFIDRSLYKAYWNDSSADYVLIKLRPDADLAAVRREIQEASAGQQQAFIYTHIEYKRWVAGVIDQFFTVYHMQIIIAILVAAIGIINTLTISVSERRRELGIIRALGGLRSQTRNMVVLEAIALTIVGVVAGAVTSVFITYFMVHTAATMIGGASLPYRFPVDLILLSFPVALIVAVAAAWWPARRAARLPVIEALGYE